MMHRRIFTCAAATSFMLLALAGNVFAQTPLSA